MQCRIPVRAQSQRGAALLIFMIIGILVSVGFLLNALSSGNRATGNQATMKRLALAKDAVIGWSAAHATTPGMLPCPENTSLIGTISEGTTQVACTSVAPVVGRLPWRSLKLPQLRDETGEPFWYALSPGFRTAPINSTKTGQLVVDTIPNSAVAIIFSAGPPLPPLGQNRPAPTAALPPDVAQYLESYNSGTGTFVSQGVASVFNDRMVVITVNDLFSVVNRRILSELKGDEANGLSQYYTDNGNTYPWAAIDASGVPVAPQLSPLVPHTVIPIASTTNTTLANNNWLPLVGYSVNASRIQATLTINTPAVSTCILNTGNTSCQ